MFYGSPAVEAWSLNHWTAREVPHYSNLDWELAIIILQFSHSVVSDFL